MGKWYIFVFGYQLHLYKHWFTSQFITNLQVSK